MGTSLQVEHLTRHFAGFTLNDVSFSVPEGMIVGLIGENGAGKSTTIKAMLDMIKRDAGKVTFWGKELSTDKAMKEEIGVVFDQMGFSDVLTAREIGMIGRASYQQWDDGLYADYLQKLKVPERKQIKDLSKGMKMKLSIAFALAHQPKLLILDEATSGLDPVMRDDILELFLDFVQDEQHSILISSHISSDLEKVADYITFIHEGKILFTKSKDTLRYDYGIIRCGQELFAQIPEQERLAWRKEAYQWSVLVEDLAEAKRKWPEAVIDRASIDEIMLLYVKGEYRS